MGGELNGRSVYRSTCLFFFFFCPQVSDYYMMTSTAQSGEHLFGLTSTQKTPCFNKKRMASDTKGGEWSERYCYMTWYTLSTGEGDWGTGFASLGCKTFEPRILKGMEVEGAEVLSPALKGLRFISEQPCTLVVLFYLWNARCSCIPSSGGGLVEGCRRANGLPSLRSNFLPITADIYIYICICFFSLG